MIRIYWALAAALPHLPELLSEKRCNVERKELGQRAAKIGYLHISYSLIAQIPGADLSRGLRPSAGTQAQGKQSIGAYR
jgi:hypothetical protein